VFATAKLKKAMVFTELIFSLPSATTPMTFDELITDESLFIISTIGPWYKDIIFSLQTQTFQLELSNYKLFCIRNQSQPYLISSDTLYHVGVDSILCRSFTVEEDERFLNKYHSRASSGHMLEYATTHKIIFVGYFWPSIFKDCILAVQKYHAY